MQDYSQGALNKQGPVMLYRIGKFMAIRMGKGWAVDGG